VGRPARRLPEDDIEGLPRRQPFDVSATEGYGTVGNWPAFSWASRAALSPASWAAFSLEWNVPEGVDGVVEVEGDVVAAAVLVVAALVTMKPPANAPDMSPTAVAAMAVRRARRPKSG
jgi:hypothetical protein